MKQEFHWKQHKPGAWQLRNNAGVKLWLAAGLRNWVLHIGDMNEELLPGNLTTREAKRMALGKLSAYIADFKNQLDRAIRTGALTEWEEN